MSNDWTRELDEAVSDLNELRRILELPPSIGAIDTENGFPLRVPRGFLDRMEKGNPEDPLLMQILPRPEENVFVEGFSNDPVGERDQVGSGRFLLQKYPGRVLLLATDHCGVHCRFCFRRAFPKRCDVRDFERILEPIRNDSGIEEIILSGGDPLMLDDPELRRVVDLIDRMPHIKRIRLHSRLPIVLPGRMTENLAGILRVSKPVYFVLHVNHPNELSEEFFERLGSFSHVVFLSQTVLIKGVNDDEETLARLFTQLIDHRIVPYYLHQLDHVAGAAHFEVEPETGLKLVERLRNRLPGFAVPKYVREEIGVPCKREISANTVRGS